MKTFDASTIDRATIDSAGNFYRSELTRLDSTLNVPLFKYTYSRDVPFRTDVAVGIKETGYQQTKFSNSTPQGIPWNFSAQTNDPRIGVDNAEILSPFRTVRREISYTLEELMTSQILNRPLQPTFMEGLNLAYQSNADQMCYVGDTSISDSTRGLINSTLVTAQAVVNGATGASPLWATKTPDEIVRDINTILTDVYNSTQQAEVPDVLLVPPTSFTYLASTKVSGTAEKSILKYIQETAISMALNGKALDIRPVRRLESAGAGGVRRMVAYCQNPKYIQMPILPIRPFGAMTESKATFTQIYIYGFGVLEVRYPETISYRDGI